MTKGIDISKWNTITDYEALKRQGIEFAMVRATYSTTVDPKFKQHMSGLQQVGIKTGAYCFSYAKTEAAAIAEAEQLLSTVSPYEMEYPLVFDFEKESMGAAQMSTVLVNKIAYAFLDTIERSGYYGLLYTNIDFYNNVWNAENKKRYGIWLADLTQNPRKTCQMWQYSFTGQLDGVKGDIDMDYSMIDFPTLIRSKGLNKLVPFEEAEPCRCESCGNYPCQRLK